MKREAEFTMSINEHRAGNITQPEEKKRKFEKKSNTYAGYIALIGRPNVGKSTLLNKILGTKISITSKKAQTTRHRILGIKTQNPYQYIYVDTPGIHFNEQHVLNKRMVTQALGSLEFADIVVWIIEAFRWTTEDDQILKILQKNNKPLLVILNKLDRLPSSAHLLPILSQTQKHLEAQNIKNFHLIPLSAKTGKNIETFEAKIAEYLPENPHFFEEDDLTDKTDRFICAEIIREKMLRLLGAEVPHHVAIEIESFKEKAHLSDISAIIWVSRIGQKKIIIGEQGVKLKTIGEQARKAIEKYLGNKVMLRLWIKVRKNWADDERALRSLGFYDE